MDYKDILTWFFDKWFITFPLTIFFIYIVLSKFRDLVFYSGKNNQLLKHSDLLNFNMLENQYIIAKDRQTKLDPSNLMELERQSKYTRSITIKNNLRNLTTKSERETIEIAKELSDVFKIK
jgi:hypothetical protein